MTNPENPQRSKPSAERYVDPVIEHYKQFVDVTMIKENLKLTPDQRVRNMEAQLRGLAEFRRAMLEAKSREAAKR